MIKLQDFAKQQGVTDRAIQKHLKTYAEELEGLYQRKGPNGTWLTDEACEILRSKMKQAPVTVFEASAQEEALRNQIQKLERELFDAQKKYTAYVENATPLLLKASEQIALAERAGEYKEQVDALKAQNAVLSADNAKKDKSLEELGAKLKGASEELTKAEEKERQLAVRTVKAENDLNELKFNIEEYEAEVQAYAELPAWKRLFKKPPTRNNKE